MFQDVDQVKLVLKKVKLQDGRDLFEANLISPIILKEDIVGFAIDPSGFSLDEIEQLKERCYKLLTGATEQKTSIVISNWRQNEQPSPVVEKHSIPSCKKIIAVMSGKGGVGKSTIAGILAMIALEKYKQVGLIDADIYGPSIPDLLDLHDKPQVKNNQLIPLQKENLFALSIGHLIPTDKAAMWRGPMVSKAINQLLWQASWPPLDLLIIDFPPGTGDIYLTLLAKLAIDEAILVSTPSTLAYRDITRSVDLLGKFNLKISAIIENMSYLNDQPSTPIFGTSQLKEFQEHYNIPTGLQLPLYPELNLSGSLFAKRAMLKDYLIWKSLSSII